MKATAVCSVSLEPPLVLVCVSKTSRFHGAISEAKYWCLSLLTVDQEALARHFSNRGRDLLSQFDDNRCVYDCVASAGIVCENQTCVVERL